MKKKKRSCLKLLFSLATCLLFTQSGITSDLIQTMVDDTQSSDILYYLTTLEGFGTRNSYTNSFQQAADFIAQEFANFGLTVERQSFVLPDKDLNLFWVDNIIATIPGTIYPEREYLLTAHYDSTAIDSIEGPFGIFDILSPESVAPGADDNASGVTAIITAAKVMSQYQFASTVKFIAFAAEEQGLVGSDDYTSKLYYTGEYDEYGQPIPKNPPDDVRAALNFDMIAYWDGFPPTGEDLEIIGYEGATHTIGEWPGLRDYILEMYPDQDPDFLIAILEATLGNPVADTVYCEWLVNEFTVAANKYNTGINLSPTVGTTAADWWQLGASDHFNFWWYGYPALLLIDDLDPASGKPSYPRYHTINDVYDYYNESTGKHEYLNIDLATGVTKTGVATIAEIAGVLNQPGWFLFSGGWNGEEVNWMNDVQVRRGPVTYSVTEAETQGWLQSTIYYFDSGSKTYKLTPGDNAYLKEYHGYWISTNAMGLELLIPPDIIIPF